MSRFTKQGTNIVSFLADLGQALFALCTSFVGWWTLLVPGAVSVLLPRWRAIICLNCFFHAWHSWAGSNCRGRVWSEGVGAGAYLCLQAGAWLEHCCSLQARWMLPASETTPARGSAGAAPALLMLPGLLTAACHRWPLLGNVIWASASRRCAVLS